VEQLGHRPPAAAAFPVQADPRREDIFAAPTGPLCPIDPKVRLPLEGAIEALAEPRGVLEEEPHRVVGKAPLGVEAA